MIGTLRSLYDYRELALMITWRDISIKYKQSVMGFLWAILMPLIIVSAGIVVKVAFAYVSDDPIIREDVFAITVKAVCWAFFVASLRFSSNSLLLNENLVTKIYFPRIIFPVSAVLSQLFDLTIAAGVLTVVLLALGVGISVQILWVPVLLLILIVMVSGLGIIFSAGSLFYRDVKYLVEIILTFAIFFTPVFYEVSIFGDWSWVFMLNPVAPVLEGMYHAVVLHDLPELWWLLYSAGFAVVVLTLAVRGFTRMEPLFAERI